ncbi:FAD-dependent oxidoreductase [Streptomyces sp. NPDC127033]|uniref:FAD-dependent oxidoreductase n=1 Tax=Streptomyces sp. NPDC127033 TaxID=3347110 RepID=UPI00366708EB
MNVLSSSASGDLIVVGAGIVGASVACHAARAGAAVTLVDAGRPGGTAPLQPAPLPLWEQDRLMSSEEYDDHHPTSL